MTDPSMTNSLYDTSSGALGAVKGVQLGSNGMAPAIGTPLTWALASSGACLQDVLHSMSVHQQGAFAPGFNMGCAGMPQMQQMQQMGPVASLPSSLLTFPFVASMNGATDPSPPPNRDMASSNDPQAGIWSSYEKEVTVMSRSPGVDRRVVLTRELLANYFHESLDAVAEKMMISKTTIKAACRRLGLFKWPYRHSGKRKKNASPSALLKQ
ncbi:hypothetical protein T484DRAFT_1895882, partial [Baffinella frigidus]